MPRKRIDGAQTRQRLLVCACEIFADKGYRDTTVAEICARANANIAAVNYHFGDKSTLYAEVLRHAYAEASARYPITGGLVPDSPARDRLRAHIEAHLRRTLSDGAASYFPRILVKEMAEPTAALRPVVKEVLAPHREHLRGILRELLGGEASEQQVRFCVISIISQCYYFGFNRTIRERLFASGQASDERLLDLIEHITSFCLAGVADSRARGGHEAAQEPACGPPA